MDILGSGKALGSMILFLIGHNQTNIGVEVVRERI